METSSSSFILDTKYNSRFLSPHQYFNTDNFRITTDTFKFKYDNLNMNGNFFITGNKLYIDFNRFNIYTNKDFYLNENILAEHNILINANYSHIICDKLNSYSTYNFVKSNQYIISNCFIYEEKDASRTNLNIDHYRVFTNAYKYYKPK